MQEGIRFGFITILIWLTLLTGYLICDKMNVVNKVQEVIILPPPLEVVGEVEYE